MFHLAAFGCQTFKGTSTYASYYFYTYSFTSEYELGFWSYYDDGSCESYPDGTTLTGAFKFGRFIGIVGALLIWAIIVVVVMASFFQFPKPKLIFRLVGGCMGLISGFSFLLLVGVAEVENLKLGVGAVLAIISALIWAGGAVSMFLGMNERKGVKSTAAKPAEAVAVVSGEAPTNSATKIATTKDDEPEITVTDNGNEDEV